MKFRRFNPFFHDEPQEFDVKLPSTHRGFNWLLAAGVILGIIVWGTVFWVAYRAIRGGH